MRLLLDTNVLSEVTRPAPDAGVLNWLHRLDEDRACISVVSIAEIARGVGQLDAGRRREMLTDWLRDDLPARFAGRIIAVDAVVALAWGEVMAQAKRSGRGVSVMEGVIAATAIVGGLTLVTRNTRDFVGLGIELIDPWSV